VYCFAWSPAPPRIIGPTAVEVKYIGESGEFQWRIGQFGNSAGFWGGERRDGHSAAWRWPLGQTANTWGRFFPPGADLGPHLAAGLRHWMEGMALEEYRLLHHTLPEINQSETELEAFRT